MEAPNGYLLKSSTEGILLQTKSDGYQRMMRPQILAGSRSSTWDIRPEDFEYSMTMIAIVEADGESMLKEGDEIAAFVNEEVRGTTHSLYIEALDAHLLFLTVYANENQETLNFKYANAETGEVLDLMETFAFEINANVGSVSEPQVFTFDQTTAVNNMNTEIALQVIPNPFREVTNISLVVPEDDLITITVTDLLGQPVRQLRVHVPMGRNWIELDAKDNQGSPLATGIYFINIEGDFGKASEKVLLTN